jgi:hypothetical protein
MGVILRQRSDRQIIEYFTVTEHYCITGKSESSLNIDDLVKRCQFFKVG